MFIFLYVIFSKHIIYFIILFLFTYHFYFIKIFSWLKPLIVDRRDFQNPEDIERASLCYVYRYHIKITLLLAFELFYLIFWNLNF
ncbi:putative integral membrane protein [Candidatus Phytoplasma phoenicium]|uniref:Putative integral membrane protein n=1 Tax=Candidatus Phytoplasma phoenicium TaxID=198422 RepID=A0A0L0MJM4_9MOLU|nr:putative integral membrane protein [Candidatus Phytoplasma phoenicium]